MTAYYSTAANPCRSWSGTINLGGGAGTPSGCTAPAWQASVADYSTVRSVRLVGAGQSIAPNGSLTVSFPMTVASTATAGQVLNNDASGVFTVAGVQLDPVNSGMATLTVSAARISGRVFEDADTDGVFDGGETPIANAVVTVTCTAGPDCVAGTAYSMASDGTGAYDFKAGATNTVYFGTDLSGTLIPNFLGLQSGT